MSCVCVAGAGPAGLSAAIFAAREGARVILVEKNRRCGLKLLTTGGGRCNITNTRCVSEWPLLFGKRGRFITPALGEMPRSVLESWLEELGEPSHCLDGRHVFPRSHSARAVRDALVAEACRLGVRIVYAERVLEVVTDNGGGGASGVSVIGLRTDGGFKPCDRVVLALGGKSYPSTGSNWEGALIAEGVGHRVVSPHPGLVGLIAENLDAGLAGLVLPEAAVSVKFKGEGVVVGRGELLLTHEGISGPAVLDLSGRVAEALDGGVVTVRISWVSGDSPVVWRERLLGWKGSSGRGGPAAYLREYIPHRLARWLCMGAGIVGEEVLARVRGVELERLVEFLGGYPARIIGTQGWGRAMVTRGGVDVREIDPGTMGSRKVGGLFFAGEMVDIDGPCGGYNLHWAFASGALAGRWAARSGGGSE